jgi:hypothetical protein
MSERERLWLEVYVSTLSATASGEHAADKAQAAVDAFDKRFMVDTEGLEDVLGFCETAQPCAAPGAPRATKVVYKDDLERVMTFAVPLGGKLSAATRKAIAALHAALDTNDSVTVRKSDISAVVSFVDDNLAEMIVHDAAGRLRAALDTNDND